MASVRQPLGNDVFVPLFFFPSRRRHTRYWRDWSSDVCSSDLTAEKLPEMDKATGFAKAFMLDGKVPEVGARLKQTEFAATLEHLAHAGLEDFYRGDVGREIAADLDRIGSPVTRDDMEKYRATVAEPLSVTIQAGTLYNSPPPTQGDRKSV